MSRSILILAVIAILAATSAAQETGTSYMLLLDNTGSLRAQLEFEKALATELTKRIIAEKSSISIFQFQQVDEKGGASPILGIGWSDSDRAVLAHIRYIETVAGQTRLIDAMRRAAENLDPRVSTRTGWDKVLIVISDGEDRASETKPKDLIKYLKDNSIQVYAIGLVDGLSKDLGFKSHSTVVKAKKFLKSVTQETGGRLVFPERTQTAADVVRQLLFDPGKASSPKT